MRDIQPRFFRDRSEAGRRLAQKLTAYANRLCATTPQPFRAVGFWYDEFSQTSDEEVRKLLARSAAANRSPEGAAAPA